MKLLDKEIESLSKFFKVFGNDTRIKILYALFEKPRCVDCIAKELKMSHSAISHQLKILRDSRLVKFKKDGLLAIYSLDDDHIEDIFKYGLEHIREVDY